MRNARVLITGGLGFIGSNLAAHCVTLGAKVTIFDSLAAHSGANPANIAGFERDLELIVGDIRAFEDVTRAVRNQDVCFHCAAHTSHVRSMTDPFFDLDVNAKGVLHVLEAARTANPDMKIVHVATSTQIGAMRVQPIDERHCEFPLDIYSVHKAASEKYALIYAAAHGLRVTVVRLANVYGPRSNIQSPNGGFVNYFIGLALQDRPMTVYGRGQQLRNLLYVGDCVEALQRAAAVPGTDGEVYFAVSARHAPIADIAAAIERRIGGCVTSVEWPRDRRQIEVGDVVIDGSKFSNAVSWQARTDLDSGLDRTREYFRPRLASYLYDQPVAALAR